MTTIKADDNGDLFVEIPDEIIKSVGWNEYTIVRMIQNGDSILIEKKSDWTIEDAQENFDAILEDVCNNKTTHKILHNGAIYCIVPYNKELESILDKHEV